MKKYTGIKRVFSSSNHYLCKFHKNLQTNENLKLLYVTLFV